MASASEKIQEAIPMVSRAMPSDYFALLKPRVMSLAVFTALCGMLVAPGEIPLPLALIAILCIAVGAGAAGALNMGYDADIDAIMSRTASRPTPSGRVAPQDAIAFGIILSAFSASTLGLLVNWLSAAMLAFTIFFYAVIYTIWLKRSTPQNIVIGGAAGAFPPVIGWAAVSGNANLEAWTLFAIIFLWTPPHFWALAMLRAKEYEKVGIPMLPNAAGIKATQRQIFIYSALLAPVGASPWLAGIAGPIYAIAAIALGIAFLWRAWLVLEMDENDAKMIPARKLFGFSITYLFVLFAALGLDALVAKAIQ